MTTQKEGKKKLSQERILAIANDVSEDMCSASREELCEVVKFYMNALYDEAQRRAGERTDIALRLLELSNDQLKLAPTTDIDSVENVVTQRDGDVEAIAYKHSEACRFGPIVTSIVKRHIIEAIRQAVSKKDEEIQALREGLSKVATNLGNGSAVSVNASIEFIAVDLPREVALVVTDLRHQLQRNDAEIAELKEALLNANQHQVAEIECLTKQLTESESNAAAMRDALKDIADDVIHPEWKSPERLAKQALATDSGKKMLERIAELEKALAAKQHSAAPQQPGSL